MPRSVCFACKIVQLALKALDLTGTGTEQRLITRQIGLFDLLLGVFELCGLGSDIGAPLRQIGLMIDQGDILAFGLGVLRHLQRLLGALEFKRSAADHLGIVAGRVIGGCGLSDGRGFGRRVGARSQERAGGGAQGQRQDGEV